MLSKLFLITDTYETKVQHTKVQFRSNDISFIIVIKDSMFEVDAQISSLVKIENILSGIDADVIKVIFSKRLRSLCSKKSISERLASTPLTTLFIT
jgi:hypothetical protein